jgi:hypothetical protein
MQATLKPHELPLIPSTLKRLLTAALEHVEGEDWEWVLANLQEAYELARVASLMAQGMTAEEATR